MVDLSTVTDPDMSTRYGVKLGTPLLTYDFVLLTEPEARDIRRNRAIEAMEKQGRKVIFHNDLPVPA